MTSAFQTSFLNSPAYRNTGLFADHYLKHPDRLQSLPEWKSATGLAKSFQKISDLYIQKASKFPRNINEPQTEDEFIRPALKILWGEDCYQVQSLNPDQDKSQQPDYAFFRTPEDRNDAQKHLGAADYWKSVPVLGEAKRWFLPLDRQRGENDNPSLQIRGYLLWLKVRWGILTNGRFWRLYEREKSSEGGVFYEVDLESLLKSGNQKDFKYFYLFFRREAFLPDADGHSFIDRVYRGSASYAIEVGDKLKESVYDALRLLMNGFIEHRNNKLDTSNPDQLKIVHNNALIVLYRLLFLLYAEDKGLLPTEDSIYYDHSLKRLHQEIKAKLREQRKYLSGEHRFWDELCELFEHIDNGLEHENKIIIPAYNGGLFSTSKFPHIAYTPQPDTIRWSIGDDALAEVIDMLAYQRDKWNEPGEDDIDYNTLDVQHLGSIYEGLLELQPCIASENLVETIEKGRSVLKPVREVPNPRPIRGQKPRTINTGEIYLVTNRGERKATGSYYTPKYIVRYIVENTVGPLADQAAEQVKKRLPEVKREVDNWEKARKEFEKSKDPNARKQVQDKIKLLDDAKRKLHEPYLTLKILDPAMGSGHFLVGAADFLSMAVATDPNLLPLEEMGDEDPQAFYKRLIVERCLYGVDLNPLAVELAKLSLWLHTVSKDKALSFLDHHLRCGNSLIGARLEEDLMTAPPILNPKTGKVKVSSDHAQLPFAEALTAMHLHYFLDTFKKITEIPTGEVEWERLKEKLYSEMDTVRDKFRRVANCWLAPYFGQPVTREQYEQAVNALRDSDKQWQELSREKWFQNAQKIAKEKNLFHWELEFPEAFFEPHGFKSKEIQGFDAVIGNPPYVSFGIGRTETLDDAMRQYYENRFSAAEYKISIYALFIQKANESSKISGRLGLILPDSFLTGRYFSKIRKLLVNCTTIERIIRFSNDFWESGDVGFPIILISLRMPTSWSCIEETVCFAECECPENLATIGSFYSSEKQITWINAFRNRFRLISNLSDRNAINRIETNTVTLDSIINMHHGIRSKVGRDKIVNFSDLGATWKPGLIASDEISRYLLWWEGNFINVDPSLLFHGGWNPEHIKQNKLLIRRTGDTIISTLDTNGFYHTNALIYGIKNISPSVDFDLSALISIVNSSIFRYYYQATTMKKGRTLPQVEIDVMEQLPIPRISFTTPASDRTRLLTESKELYKTYLSSIDCNDLLSFVSAQLSATPERSDVIHDLLAFLAEQMIEMNKQKQSEIKGFLTWLERQIGAKINDLSNKTKLQAYHDYNLATLIDILSHNCRKLRIDPNSRSFQESFEHELKSSMEKLTPLKSRLALTDRLIDQIVYKLYGLTEEEIAIVEGKK